MKLKAIARICKDAGRIWMFDHVTGDAETVQWVGNGAAAYPIHGLPRMEIEHICTAFELSGDALEKMQVEHTDAPVGICFDDFADWEVRADEMTVGLLTRGRELKALELVDEVIFVDKAYLDPIPWVRDGAEFFARRGVHGTKYIAVKQGLLLVAVIFPYDPTRGALCEDLARLAEKCAIGGRLERG